MLSEGDRVDSTPEETQSSSGDVGSFYIKLPSHQPYFREDPTHVSTNGRGSGLGLSPPGAACDGSSPILHQLFPPILTSHKRFFNVPSGVMSQEIRSPVGEAASFPT
jgi:hypothetical protein